MEEAFDLSFWKRSTRNAEERGAQIRAKVGRRSIAVRNKGVYTSAFYIDSVQIF